MYTTEMHSAEKKRSARTFNFTLINFSYLFNVKLIKCWKLEEEKERMSADAHAPTCNNKDGKKAA